jgi:hypothetical protein
LVLVGDPGVVWQRGKADAQDLREQVFAASNDGSGVGEVAEARLAPLQEAIRAEVATRPDAALSELRGRLAYALHRARRTAARNPIRSRRGEGFSAACQARACSVL